MLAAEMDLPLLPLANPCRNWQGGWAAPCKRLCCHTHPRNCPCADIACDGCSSSIVRPDGATTAAMNGRPPSTRYVCVGCPVDAEYDADHWSTQLCEPCFGSASAAPHFGADGASHSARWLRVDGATGEHAVVTRPAMDPERVELVQITAAELTVHAGEGVVGEDCAHCCCDAISVDNPVASPPGCSAHKCCVSGVLAQLSASNRLTYARPTSDAGGASATATASEQQLPPPTYFCIVCAVEKRKRLEVNSVLRELDLLLAAWTPTAGDMLPGGALARAVAALKAAHALKAGDPSINAHLHEALDGRLAAAAKPRA